jgi:hypothetical protein
MFRNVAGCFLFSPRLHRKLPSGIQSKSFIFSSFLPSHRSMLVTFLLLLFQCISRCFHPSKSLVFLLSINRMRIPIYIIFLGLFEQSSKYPSPKYDTGHVAYFDSSNIWLQRLPYDLCMHCRQQTLEDKDNHFRHT